MLVKTQSWDQVNVLTQHHSQGDPLCCPRSLPFSVEELGWRCAFCCLSPRAVPLATSRESDGKCSSNHHAISANGLPETELGDSLLLGSVVGQQAKTFHGATISENISLT